MRIQKIKPRCISSSSDSEEDLPLKAHNGSRHAHHNTKKIPYKTSKSVKLPTKRTKSSSSAESSSEGDLPLKIRVPEIATFITKKDLLKKTQESCDFCDDTFKNKYNLLIHNASHIIIPLCQSALLKCHHCDENFRSLSLLEWHCLDKHMEVINRKKYFPETVKSIVRSESETIIERDDSTKATETQKILQSLVNKEPITVLTKELFLDKEKDDEVLKNFTEKEAVTLVEPLMIENDVINISDDDNSSNIDGNNAEDIIVPEQHKIKDKLMFEEFDDEINDFTNVNGLMIDLTTDCNVRLDLDVSVLKGSKEKNAITLGKYPTGTTHRSVHYSELISRGFFKCRHCLRSFTNRYDLIIHETSHINIKTPLPFLCRMCDWYIGRDRWSLRRHQMAKHPDQTLPAPAHKTCNMCNLKFIKRHRHMRNYHNVFICKVKTCRKQFELASDYSQHKKEHSNVDSVTINDFEPIERQRELQVCDMCYMFMKNKTNVHYKHIRDINVLGKRYQCEWCAKTCFELKVVVRKVKKRLVNFDRLTQERKKISNVDRLKNVQQRLKKIKNLNKF